MVKYTNTDYAVKVLRSLRKAILDPTKNIDNCFKKAENYMIQNGKTFKEMAKEFTNSDDRVKQLKDIILTETGKQLLDKDISSLTATISAFAKKEYEAKAEVDSRYKPPLTASGNISGQWDTDMAYTFFSVPRGQQWLREKGYMR